MPVGKRNNILIITDIFYIMAGSERNISYLLTGVDESKFQLFVASFASGTLAQDMRNKGFTIFDLHKGGIYTLNGLRNLAFLWKVVKENNISLIVTYHEGSDFYGLVLSKICNIPVISNRRDMGFKTKRHHDIAYKLFGGFFDGVVAVCHAVKNEVVNRGWFAANRIVPIYNGVDIREHENNGNRFIETLRKDIGIEINHKVVGMVANLRKIKGIQLFIEAASLISKRNSNIEFVIIGGDQREAGCTREELELFAKRLDVHKKIHFLGKRNDIPDLISIFDVAAVSSLSEGFSNVILEYMASSKPVVATDVGGNSEAVVHGETGLVVPPGDPYALAEAILSILENREMALRFGMAGRKQVEKKFTLEKMIKKYEDIFERAILKEIIRYELKNSTID